MRDVSRSFGGLQALKDVSFTIQEGRIHGIIGPNGSGKTTLLNCITGILPLSGGKILLGEDVLSEKSADIIANMGVRRTFQEGKIVPSLTVIENVMCGFFNFVAKDVKDTFCFIPSRRAARERRLRQKAVEALEVVGMLEFANRWAGDLVWVERQFVQVARALVSHPRFLLLDEPASGMGSGETEKMETLIRMIKDRGVSVVVVSHDMKMLMGLADMITVLHFGDIIAEGFPEEIQGNRRVREAYLGVE